MPADQWKLKHNKRKSLIINTLIRCHKAFKSKSILRNCCRNVYRIRQSDSFCSQTLYRISDSRFNGLKADGN